MEASTPTHAASCLALAVGARTATLATLADRPELYPFASLVNVAWGAEGRAILLLSALAEHTHNLAAHPEASLLVVASAADGRDPRQAGRCKGAYGRDTPECDGQPANPAEGSEQRAFRQQLAHQAPASGAERGAHCKFAPARRRSRQQQVADVRADHQKQKSDDAQQHQKGRSDVADDLIVQ